MERIAFKCMESECDLVDSLINTHILTPKPHKDFVSPIISPTMHAFNYSPIGAYSSHNGQHYTHNSNLNCKLKNLWSSPSVLSPLFQADSNTDFNLSSRFIQKLQFLKSFREIPIESETKISDEEENHVILLTSLANSNPQKRCRDKNTEKKNCCNCQKSKCLKLYCECFAAREYCAGCSCVGCYNIKEQEAIRRNAINATLERNPNAFKPKFKAVSVKGEVRAIHNRGCHCSKSGCSKKYCECYQNGNSCSDSCQCTGCKNQSVQVK